MQFIKVEQVKGGERKLVWQGSGDQAKLRIINLSGGRHARSKRWLRLINSAGVMDL